MSFEHLGRAVALYDYRGSTDEEINFYEGDIFIILEDEHEEWTFVQIEGTQARGYVPKSYIKLLSSEEEPVRDNESIATREVEEKNDGGSDGYDSKDSYSSEEDRSKSEEEDDLFEESLTQQEIAKLAKRRRSSFEVANEEEVARSQQVRRQKLLKNMETAMATRHGGTVSNEMAPPGYIVSYLGHERAKLDKRLSYSLFPQFDESGLGFKDLFYNHKKMKIRRRGAKCVVAFSILEARNITPIVIPGYQVLERRVRMGLFDKKTILGNIHTIQARQEEQETKWRFSSKNSLLFPKDDENTCFVRTNDIDINLTLLFEITVLVKKGDSKGTCRISNPQDNSNAVELSAGWGVLPMFTSDGGPIENRSHNIRLYPGSPFDKGNGLVASSEPRGFFQSIFNSTTHQTLDVRVWKLGKSVLNEINQLPDTLVTLLSAVPLLAFYRNILAHTLYSPHMEGKNFALMDPSLALLPQIVDSLQLLHLASDIWERKLRGMKRKELNSFVIMRERFTETVLVVWPLLVCVVLLII